jgi:leader peptidase (prepilin peptidase)/N-methyltransferase
VGQPRYRCSVLDAELWAELATSPGAYALAALLGALWGSFGNVCIYRMPPSEEHPEGRSVVAPGSHCFACGKAVRWYDNVPLLSFLWLKGACRDCGASFSPRYLLVEAATALLFVASYHYVVGIAHIDDSPADQLIRFGVLAAFLWTMVVITFIDLDHQLILDKLTYPAIPIFYGLGLLLPGSSWKAGLIGALVGYGFVRLISDGFYLLTKREGMGYGDGKLLAVVGALFGWQGVMVSLFLGSMLGTAILVPLLLILRSRAPEMEESTAPPESAAAPQGEEGEEEPEQEAQSDAHEFGRIAVPFGPFLAGAAVIYLFSESFLRVRFWVFWEFWQ